VTARFLQFKTLSSTYGSGNVGLNEIQVIADLTPGKLNAAPAALLSWPYGPIRMVLQSSADGQTWNPVADVPVLSGLTYKVFKPAQEGVAYRLVPQ
jgi:hypothetical protein